MEGSTDCQSVSINDVSDSLDCSSSISTCSSLSSPSFSSVMKINDDEDVVSRQKMRREYRFQYLRCKRMRAKGYRVPIPVKPRQMMQTKESKVADSTTTSEVLSKEEMRRIKNRESAERSRQAINEAIDEAEHGIRLARQEQSWLQTERSFLLQQMTLIANQLPTPAGQFGEFAQQTMSHYFYPEPYVPNTWVHLDSSSVSGESLSELTDSSSSRTSSSQEYSGAMDDLDFDLTEEALELLLNNL